MSVYTGNPYPLTDTYISPSNTHNMRKRVHSPAFLTEPKLSLRAKTWQLKNTSEGNGYPEMFVKTASKPRVASEPA